MSSRQLEGQVAVVTGGASGIGRATVHALAAAGAHVAVLDRDAEGAASVAKEARQHGIDASEFTVDVSVTDTIEAVVQDVLARFGRIDVLVNSAGMTDPFHNAIDFSDDLYDLIMAVNVRAPFVFTRAVGRHMVERGGGGRIINLSSSAAFRATAAPVIYAASKAAINGLTRAAAADLGPHDINVNAVAPGLTKTPMTGGIGNDESYLRLVSSGPLENLVHRPSEAEDVAGVILFLCLPESRQITGQVIHTSAGNVV